MEKRISFFWTAGFFLPAINATVFSKKFIHKKILPSGQMHSKEPISFLHSPPKHNPGMASHSLISMHFPVWTFFKNPGWQDNFSGQLSQGCPQAFPIVAQQSCLVQTTPSNCPVHISFSMRLFGAIHKWRYHFPGGRGHFQGVGEFCATIDILWKRKNWSKGIPLKKGIFKIRTSLSSANMVRFKTGCKTLFWDLEPLVGQLL